MLIWEKSKYLVKDEFWAITSDVMNIHSCMGS